MLIGRVHHVSTTRLDLLMQGRGGLADVFALSLICSLLVPLLARGCLFVILHFCTIRYAFFVL